MAPGRGIMTIPEDHKKKPKCRCIILSFHKPIFGLHIFFVADVISKHQNYFFSIT